MKPPLTPIFLTLRGHNTLRKLFVLGLVFLLTLLSAHAEHDFVRSRGVLMDPKGTLTIDEVARKDFQPISGPISRGFTASAIWLRIEVAPSNLPSLVLVVQPQFLDDVRLYSLKGDGWRVQQQGDRFPYRQRPRSEVFFAFDVDSQASEPAVYYVRMQTTSTAQIHVKVLSPAESQSQDMFLHVWVSLYLGVVLMLLAFSIFYWLRGRDAIWLITCLHQVVTIGMALTYLGFTAKYLFPNTPSLPDLSVSYIGITLFYLGVLFFYCVLKDLLLHWVQLLPFRLVVWFASPLLIVLLLLGHVRLAVSINALLILFVPLVQLIIHLFVRHTDKVLGRLINVTFTCNAVYLILFSLPLLGLGTMSTIHLYPVFASNLFVSIMGFCILNRRDQLARRAATRALISSKHLAEQLVREKKQAAESSSFMAMLLHEIKAPLSVIRLSASSLGRDQSPVAKEQVKRLERIQESVTNVNAVLERIHVTGKLELGHLNMQPALTDVVALLRTCAERQPQADRIEFKADQAVQVMIDPDLLQMMVGNLLANALAYSPAHSPVSIDLQLASTANSANRCVIRVTNHVGEVGAPDPAKLFTKYYRAPLAFQSTGTGLGLYWVHGVAAHLNGNLRYVPTQERVVFELALPC